MIKGSRQLPLRHISIRVPWHQTKWDGTVCPEVKNNTSCLALTRISKERDDDWETSWEQYAWKDIDEGLPICSAENGAFMAPFSFNRKVRHPYSANQLYKHFQITNYKHLAYSATAVPFAWMMKEQLSDGPEGPPPLPANSLELGYRPELEPTLGFKTLWVQDRRNQLVMLDTYFSAIQPKQSLVFFYAKKTPLSEDPRRVIVGIGRVLKIHNHVEYDYENLPQDGIRCVVWERLITHSIRPEIGDGFLLPYQELLELSQEDSSIDLSDFILHAPEESWDEFSMGSEHVSHDSAIRCLISCSNILERISKILPGNWDKARNWVDSQLNYLWKMRGAYPGFGSALSAFGAPNGTLFAHFVESSIKDELADPWPCFEGFLHNPKKLPSEIRKQIGPNILKRWKSLSEIRLNLLKLLARFNLTESQAKRWYVQELRKKAGISLEDKEILENPYLLYEEDRFQEEPVSVYTIDQGLFPDPIILEKFPFSEPEACSEPIDWKRIRAFSMELLEKASQQEGHTLLPQDWLVQRLRDLNIRHKCPVEGEWLEQIKENLFERVALQKTQKGELSWQLNELKETKEIIEQTVLKRTEKGKRHEIQGPVDWRVLVDDKFDKVKDGWDKHREEMARQEKAAALEELFASRFSVLVGPAGTGKTTLLSILCNLPQVKDKGVLALAPTGKARVQLQRTGSVVKAKTIAQFLLGYKRYNPVNGNYRVTRSTDKEEAFATVIIDECSMLTENMLAATLDALKGVQRLILVGDYRQLPPIGPGRPFVDIVKRLIPENVTQIFPRKGKGYAELTIPRRYELMPNSESIRDDLRLAKWFSNEPRTPGDDEIWERIVSGKSKTVQVINWEDPDNLEEQLIDLLVEKLGLSGREDENGFGQSLGGNIFNEVVYFHKGNENRKGAGPQAENWQILSPIRSGQSGVEGINRRIQQVYRPRAKKWAAPQNPRYRKTAKPMGADSILYGDKVINLINQKKRRTYPKIANPYLANGEIGMVVGQYKSKKDKYKGLPWELQVEFSTQPTIEYKFTEKDFGEDVQSPLELAYALTIHKAQGSEFNFSFLVIPNPCFLLSRELLYTALTRHKQNTVILHQGDFRELQRLSNDSCSEIARKITNLFSEPSLVEVQVSGKSIFLEENLIHRTRKGDLVRSKSEVAIADLLDHLGLDYKYEAPFSGKNNRERYPDFTIEDEETGNLLLIEHLGLMGDPYYEQTWERKLNWYRASGIDLIENGGGEQGSLLVTKEKEGLDIKEIEKQIRNALDL